MCFSASKNPRAWALTCLVLASSVHATAQDEPWQAMDYGPFLSAAIEVTPDNIACKGIAIPLDDDGEHSMLFDSAELRWAAAWEGDFVQLRGIVYDGPHGIWPRIDGKPAWVNAAGPGIAVGSDGTFADPRPVPFGPLPPELGRWRGLQRDRDGVLLHYTVGKTRIFERAAYLQGQDLNAWKRSIQFIGVDQLLRISLLNLEENTFLSPSFSGPNSEFILLRKGKPVMAIDARGGGARTRVTTHEGRVVLVVRPGAEELAPVHIHIAHLDQEHLEAFRAITGRIYFRDPSPLASVWKKGSAALWPEQVILRGERNAIFGGDENSDPISRSAGDEGDEWKLTHEDGDVARIHTRDGQQTDQKSASTRESLLVITPETRQPKGLLAGWDCDESSGDAMQSIIDGEKDLRLEGVTWRRGVKGRALDFDGTARAIWTRHDDFEFTSDELTFAAWVHTTKDGSIFSQTAAEGPWIHDGKTFFIRDGHLCFDIGWVGVVTGDKQITDGRWHHVAFTWNPWEARVVLYVDGEQDGEGSLPPGGPVEDTIMQIGFTAENFPANPWFSGYIDGIRIYSAFLNEAMIHAVATESGEPLVRAYGVRGDLGARFLILEESDSDSQMQGAITFDATENDRQGELLEWNGPLSRLPEFISKLEAGSDPAQQRPFEIDRISWPDENPWHSWMRFGDFDFLDDGKAAAISTWNGDVWRVSGLDGRLDKLTWQRIASGLSQPLGLLTRGEPGQEEILVLGRDQITRLRDLDGDGETDYYEAFNVDAMNSPHFHEPAGGLQEGPDGNIYYLKAARHAKLPVHPQHGTLIQVAADGSTSKIVASGFRAPNGVAIDADGIVWGSDQEGHWMPANRINRITPGSFHGNNWSGSMLGAEKLRTDYDLPLCWIHSAVDRSPAAQLRVPDGVWGDLSGKLLGLSYGTGEVYLIIEDEVDGVHQGGCVPLPIETPTGTMRGRFHPDGSLYLSGLFGWSSNKTDPGGFYRVRKTAASLPYPLHIRVLTDGLRITFNEPITTETEALASAFKLEGWNYRWSSNYGSPKLDLDEGKEGTTQLEVASATLSKDGKQVRLVIPDMKPAMQMHLNWALQFDEIGPAQSFVHFTVHRLASTREGL
ncbi:MAG: DUF6797 domain-containing protein [Planctomycetota bacterium]